MILDVVGIILYCFVNYKVIVENDGGGNEDCCKIEKDDVGFVF